MSLNWKEINLILEELDLPGSQIQGIVQSAYDLIGLKLHKKSGGTKMLLIALSPGACRIHETFRPLPKNEKPLRFAQFFKSRIVNGWIQEAVQLGDNRIIRLLVKRGEFSFRLYIRLWTNAANCIVTDENGNVLDAMRRLPKKGEVSGGRYTPEENNIEIVSNNKHEYTIRKFTDLFPSAPPRPCVNPLPTDSFNAKIDAYYAEKGGRLSLEVLREQARKNCEGSIGRLQLTLERLQEKEKEFAAADRLREYGDIILANISLINDGDEWLEADDFFGGKNEKINIKLDPNKSSSAQAELYYEKYSKAKNGLADIRAEIESGKRELYETEKKLEKFLAEENPLVLAKLIQSGTKKSTVKNITNISSGKKRPGLAFRCGEWLILIGRDASENDALLRRFVKGGDLWLHARDFPGSYVFIKQRPGKTFPLDILLDAGNLAIFYSKGRNSGKGDLFYTQVKYLRRVKDGPKGLVIPTQEKNLHIVVDENRLKKLENCRSV